MNLCQHVWVRIAILLKMADECESTYRSPTRGRKAAWSRSASSALGESLWHGLPDGVRHVVMHDGWKGSAQLIVLKDNVGWRVCSGDLVKNKANMLR